MAAVGDGYAGKGLRVGERIYMGWEEVDGEGYKWEKGW